jgi:hypothetical protein
MILISFALPFTVNASTTVSSRWYGPKGRNLATGILLLCIFIPVGLEVVLGEGFEHYLKLVLPILSTIWTLLCFGLIYDKPEFSPTLSEEDKTEVKKRFPEQINFKAQLKDMIGNMPFLMIACSSALMLANVNELYSVLSIFYQAIDTKNKKIIFIVDILHKLCQLTGVLTFSVALYGGLSLKSSYKVLVYQFFFVYVLQVLSMLSE